MNRNPDLLLPATSIVIIGGLALFTWQNWSPSLSLTFLGLTSIPLPVSILVLGGFVAGIATYSLIYSIFELSNYLLTLNLEPARPQSRNIQDREKRRESTKTYIQSDEISDSQSFINLNKDKETGEEDENFDDWEEGPPKVKKSWDNSTKEEDIEESEEAKTESKSGSVYSYGYREPSGSGVGQTESVYDADFRVITPPPPRDTSKSSEDKETESDETIK
ncbi:hypothetical protein [Okeania sp.]|uniref:hypothetical protein n=1 Tax=Okeania sp. TaxID=3100323 RepID=UPI002B4B90DA|nr:hypothetical protein [Okeania sp.]MEB3341188.1 hypothetical protein [Okeania sp.]